MRIIEERDKRVEKSKKGKRAGESIWSLTFITLFVVNLFQITAQMMMNTIIPIYARDMGAASGIIGFVTGSFAITALLIKPVASPAFDSFSKKKILFSAQVLIVICSFLYGFADNIALLIGVRMLHGVAMGCTGPLSLSLVTETLPLNHLSSGISTFSLGQALAQAIGPALGLALVDAVDFQWTFRIAGISMFMAACLILTIKEPLRTERPKYRFALNRCFAKNAVPPAILTFIFAGANTSIMSFLAIYGGLMDITQIGLYFTLHSIVLLITRPLFGRMAERHGYTKVIIPGLIAYVVAFILISQSSTLWMFLLASVVAACGFGTCSPLFQAISMESVPRNRSGAASSTSFIGMDFAQLIAPSFFGIVAERSYAATGSEVMGYSQMYLVVALVVFLGIFVYLALRKRMERNIAQAAVENRKNETSQN